MQNFFGIITANVLHDKLLKASEKLIFCEITSALGSANFCILDVEALAEQYDCTEQTIRSYLSSLEKRGYIETSTTPKSKTKVKVLWNKC